MKCTVSVVMNAKIPCLLLYVIASQLIKTISIHLICGMVLFLWILFLG
jgi:hypothetical protein